MIDNGDIPFVTKHFSFYDTLQQNEKTSFLKGIQRVSFLSGSVLTAGSQSCLGTILIERGSLQASILSAEGREITLFTLQDEEICTLSASCLFMPKNFNVHITAQTDTSAFLLPLKVFSALCDSNIYAENFSYKITVKRFASVMEAIEPILFDRVDTRIIRYLLSESKSRGDTLYTTQEQLAKNTGTAREVVSRILKKLQEQNIITQKRGAIHIINRDALAAL